MAGPGRPRYALTPSGIGDPSGTEKALEDLRAMGATTANVTVKHTSLKEYLEQLEAFQQLAFPRGQ